jgi:hypothetical protein
MNERPKIEETYRQLQDIINFVVYRRTDGAGEDEVLQHKLHGLSETAHITLHPNGQVNLRIERTKEYLVKAVRNDLAGYLPSPSLRLRQFIAKVKARTAGLQNI